MKKVRARKRPSARSGFARRAPLMAKIRMNTAMRPGRVLQAGAVATPSAVIRKPSEVIPRTLASSEAVSSRGMSMIVEYGFELVR